ncbi:hypothetical protein ACE6H2_021004 [Prunus campanulata]
MKKKTKSLFVYGSDLLHLVFSIPEKKRREISKIVINKEDYLKELCGSPHKTLSL